MNRFLNGLLTDEYGCTKVSGNDQHVRRIRRTEHFVPGRSPESISNALLNAEYGCTKVWIDDQRVRRIEGTEHFVPGRSLELFFE